MKKEKTSLRKLSEFSWRLVEICSRSGVCINPEIANSMQEAISNYRTNGFCFFNPYGEDELTLHENIDRAIKTCNEVLMHPDSCTENYRASSQLRDPVFLEDFNQYMRFGELHSSALQSVTHFLTFHNDLIVAMLGYSFMVLNVRCQISEPGATVPPFYWHTDEFPDSVVKIIYYLDGASETMGSTAVKLRSQNDEEIIFEGDIGSWVLIDVNNVEHQGIPSKNKSRRMLEITLGPSVVGDTSAYCASLNASYPWVPWLSPVFTKKNSRMAKLLDEHSTHFNQLVSELKRESPSDSDNSSGRAHEILKLNAENPPLHLNVGGGPGFLHEGWRNFEEIFSVNNPVPFRLSPDVPFPLANNSLETVYTSHNLEHLNDETVLHVLTESYRVLAPESFLVIKIPDFDLYLEKWREGDKSLTFDNSPFSFKESRTWRNKNIPDNISYRTAEMFCGVWNETFGDGKALFSNAGDWNGPGYVGAPWVAQNELDEVFKTYSSCHEISAWLKGRAMDLGEKVYLNHQNAWSRVEMQALLESLGFKLLSMDGKRIVENGRYIPGIEQWYTASAYYLAQKPSTNK